MPEAIMKDVLIVEVPTLSDETVASMQNFFEAFMKAFESHYCCQLDRYYYRPNVTRSKSDKDEPPF
jgi:hypothetical protein